MLPYQNGVCYGGTLLGRASLYLPSSRVAVLPNIFFDNQQTLLVDDITSSISPQSQFEQETAFLLVRNIIAWAYTKDETLTGYAVRVMRTPNYRWGGLMSNSSFLLLFVRTEKSFLSADY